MPLIRAWLPAISKDIPDESTEWKLPSTSVAFRSTMGKPATTPSVRDFTTPFSTEGMYSLGTAPPTMAEAELEAGRPGHGLKLQPHVAELSVAARLLLVPVLDLGHGGDRPCTAPWAP